MENKDKIKAILDNYKVSELDRHSLNQYFKDSHPEVKGTVSDEDIDVQIESLNQKYPYGEYILSRKQLAKTIAEWMRSELLSLTSSKKEEGELNLYEQGIEDAWIDRLLVLFNANGINTDNWDGDDEAQWIVVSGVLREIEVRTENLKAELENSEKAHDLTLDMLMKEREKSPSIDEAEAVGFAEWLWENAYVRKINAKNIWIDTKDRNKEYTTSELHSLYLKTKGQITK